MPDSQESGFQSTSKWRSPDVILRMAPRFVTGTDRYHSTYRESSPANRKKQPIEFRSDRSSSVHLWPSHRQSSICPNKTRGFPALTSNSPSLIYTADNPPSMGMMVPVTWGDSSDARYKARRATSTGCAILYKGIFFI